MELNLKKADNNENFLHADEKLNLNYLYPDGQRMTNQMRLYKVHRDKGLELYFAA